MQAFSGAGSRRRPAGKALRRREILEPVLAEIVYRLAGDEVTRRLRQEHLAPVPAAAIRAARWTSIPT